ncbi:sensor domain-containing diguanylate cyclase [Burkholderia sp. L27(2015)]|uniref:sensor domain-containing diguanylate cyclase n=1 Tax=Burkholderia sp. L27(2015) TaxID=1641858 RepID=UPI00131D8635|nr:sensor domain-containing diguanylate cyclase [Burkholderia sp. L27(2015)]
MEGMIQLPTTRFHALSAGAVALAILTAFCLTWPWANFYLTPVDPFLPIFNTAVFCTESLTAVILCVQFTIFRQPYLAALSGAFGFVTVADLAQLLVFPDIFAPTGLFGANSQSAAWIWVFWHGGFPIVLLIASVIKRHWGETVLEPRHTIPTAVALIGGPMLVSAALCYLAIAAHGSLLSTIIVGHSYLALVHNPVSVAVVLANLLALLTIALASRTRAMLELWICIALLAASCDVIITFVAGARGTLGWYTARCLSVVSATAVLSMLFWEFNRLYRNLSTANTQLTEYSIRDGLTGIHNRRYFDEFLAREVEHARRTGKPLSLLMADVDFFKPYNDTLGHLQGDACLIAVAQALASQIRRSGDLLARYGGEEFVVVLPCADRDSATFIAEKLREAVFAAGIAAPASDAPDHPGVVTLSIGAATMEPSGDSRNLLAAADQALYMAKHAGRNRVCVAAPAALAA